MNIQEVLARHKKWLENDEGGQRAYLREADLQDADLRDADLQDADLQGADLRDADLQRANLQRANLRGADLQGADLDLSCWPLWCGSKGVIVDLRIVYQLLAHVACLQCDDPEYAEIQKAIMPYAVKSHRALDLGLSTEEEV